VDFLATDFSGREFLSILRATFFAAILEEARAGALEILLAVVLGLLIEVLVDPFIFFFIVYLKYSLRNKSN